MHNCVCEGKVLNQPLQICTKDSILFYIGYFIMPPDKQPDIFLSDDGGVSIDASREASLEMADTPTNASTSTASPPDPTPTQVVSMYQTNSIALRAERFINWQRRRDAAVAWLDNVAYSAGSPA